MASKLLSKSELPSGLLLNGEIVPGESDAIVLVSAKDGSTIVSDKVHSASEAQVDTAVRHARAAFPGWAATRAPARANALNKLADLIDEYTDEITHFESVASGRPVSNVKFEMPMVTAVLRYYAGWCGKQKGDSYPTEDGFYKIVQHEPLGVCAAVTAWNGSLHFFAFKVAPAVATGNTIIVKPSEKSPLSTLACGYLAEAAGFPPGVIQVVTGTGVVGSLLSSHMDIDKISFTGSTNVGRKIKEASAKSNLKRTTLELGGKSAGIIFDDCDLQKAVFWSVIGVVTNTGQVCSSTSRLLVQKGIADKFLEQLSGQFKAMGENLGLDYMVEGTQYGPLIDKAQFERVSAYLEKGKKVAKVLVGGETFSGKGYYAAPTIFLDPPGDSVIYKEEIFGPVVCVRTFETEDEAIALANDTAYGLAGSVYTQDVNRALRVSSKVRAGTVGVNCSSIVGPQVPMGGFGQSGDGRELGEYALAHYTEPKSIWINMN